MLCTNILVYAMQSLVSHRYADVTEIPKTNENCILTKYKKLIIVSLFSI